MSGSLFTTGRIGLGRFAKGPIMRSMQQDIARSTPVAHLETPVPESVWAEVLASAPTALPTQTLAWLRCVCAVDGYADASRLYHAPDGRRLLLPLVRRRFGRWSPMASLPVGWGPAGLLGEGGIVRPEDVAMVIDDLRRCPAVSVRLRPDPSAASVWSAGVPAGVDSEARMAQAVPLEGGFDAVWRTRFRSDTRTRVRRAERAGVVVECDDTGTTVPAFHRLYTLSVARWAQQGGGLPAIARWSAARREPERKVGTVASTPDAGCRIYLAHHDGRPVAGIVVIFAAGTAAYWRGAMDATLAGSVYANYLLHRTAIQDAAGAGCSAYVMGESAPGSSLALFKSRFGAVEQHYATYRIERLPIAKTVEAARRGYNVFGRLRPRWG
jgi:hypothetical protein